MKSAVETEVKIPVSDRQAVLARIREAGLVESVPRLFEANTLFDTVDQALRRRNALLRLRDTAGKCIITWKGPAEPGPHKSRPELETGIGSLDVLHQILENLGYQASFRYEKYRTEFIPKKPSSNHTVTLDETPIGDYLEIEGPGDWIDQTAVELGFSSKDYVLESYGKLYLEYCERHGIPPANMVFTAH